MPNKPQKPADQLQFRRGGRQERRTLRVATPDQPRPIPAAPKGLGKVGKAVWRAYWADPVSLVATPVDRYDIERYCRLVERRAEIEEQLVERPVVLNQYGEQPNPLFKVARELTREIEKTREQLGILPLARMRLGLVAVQQKATAADLRAKLRREAATPQRPATPVVGEVIDLT